VTGAPPYWLAATSSQGELAYISGQRGAWHYVWRDRQGKNLGTFGDAGAVVMISPDGKSPVGDFGQFLWRWDFARGAATRLTFGPGSGFNPIWSPDGRYVAYGRVGVGIFRKPANGAGVEELLLPVKALAVPKSWSPDGRFILFAQINPGTSADLLCLPVVPDPKPFVLAGSSATEDQGQFSPDGKWVAYTSNESGQSEIYVISVPASPRQRQMDGVPRWRRAVAVAVEWQRAALHFARLGNDGGGRKHPAGVPVRRTATAVSIRHCRHRNPHWPYELGHRSRRQAFPHHH
jgi:Tol biopolymer transport system component